MRPAIGNLLFVRHPEAVLTVERQVNFFHGFEVTRQTLPVSPFQDRLDQQAAHTVLLLAGFQVKKSEVHGMSQRGGDVISTVRYGDEVFSPLPALKETVVRLQQDLKELIGRQIPETLKAIQVAKEHGDLSENFEYHAARARQELLSARAAQLQADLARIKVIDPATIDPARVRVGTRVRLEPEGGGDARTFTILGPYEGDPEHGVLSIGSEAAQALLDRAAGDPVTLDGERWTVAAIERAT